MSNQRTPTPEKVLLYWEMQKTGGPKFCHTCDSYRGDGTCERHGMRPPDEFTQTEGACNDWICEIPF